MHISWNNNIKKKRENIPSNSEYIIYILYRLKYCFINIFRHEPFNAFIKSFANSKVAAAPTRT